MKHTTTNSYGEKVTLMVHSVELLMVESSITEHGERDFSWQTSYINGREIASGTAVSQKQAEFLATKAYENEVQSKCAPVLPSYAPRTTL